MASFTCIAAHGVNIRPNHSTTGKRVGKVQNGQTITTIDEFQGSSYKWYKINHGAVSGWVAYSSSWWKDAGAREDPTLAQSTTGKQVDSNLDETNASENPFQMTLTAANNYYNQLNSGLQTFSAQSFHSIIGMPFQFTPQTDHRLGTSKYGRAYSEHILYDAPIAIMSVGGPKFLAGTMIGKTEREGVAGLLLNSSNETSVADKLSEILNGKNARYYSFLSQYEPYMKYVNTLCRLSSHYLGIHDLKYRGTPYKNFDWKKENVETDGGNGLDQLFGLNNCVHIYYQPTSGSNESNSNGTKESMLSSAMGSASDLAKEADFFLGAGAGVRTGATSGEFSEIRIDEVSSMVGNNDPNFFKRLFGRGSEAFNTVISGSNFMFPEIWSDSNFSRSYSLDIKLASPYGDPESIFLHVLKPLWFLMAAAFPRAYGPNSFTAPFLLQMHAKGMFNTELAIVDSISIRRAGGGDKQTYLNLPTEIEVSINIKDLYGLLSMSRDANTTDFINNIGLLDYISAVSGTSLNKPNLARKLDVMISSKINQIRDIPGNVTASVQDGFRDVIYNFSR